MAAMELDDILGEFDAGAPASNPGKDISDLTTAWIAERTAPEILPFQTQLVERLTDRIRQQIELVETETGNMDPAANFRLILIQTELERVKYLIDKYGLHVLSNNAVRANLASSELAYLKSHLALLNNHYLASFLRNFPEPLRRLDDTAGGLTMIEEPDMESAVFCRVVKEPIDGTVRIPGTDTEFELRKDDVYVVRYSAIRQWVMTGEVELI
ncbi:Similar to DNA replication complex GINS protein SLD5; acc. no. Q2HE71 [Pyronema omphalodes CBS 100304]|uniref:DNA replication complex GINS protein SLD5 n=1 Tax=Pyronema omphalodes (strain CBS 100304) TaxID=1076935 RepID=U4LGK3_PYROM|nr:Similar to DNA replication complex GINS protein SLD5; acc. no. Q2HE71 [Pyronema omphalodes CBS 100304]